MNEYMKKIDLLKYNSSDQEKCLDLIFRYEEIIENIIINQESFHILVDYSIKKDKMFHVIDLILDKNLSKYVLKETFTAMYNYLTVKRSKCDYPQSPCYTCIVKMIMLFPDYSKDIVDEKTFKTCIKDIITGGIGSIGTILEFTNIFKDKEFYYHPPVSANDFKERCDFLLVNEHFTSLYKTIALFPQFTYAPLEGYVLDKLKDFR